MNDIIDIAKRYGLFIVEDAAPSVGAMYHGRPVSYTHLTLPTIYSV